MKQITDVSYLFSEIRKRDAEYVDKTAYLHQLVVNDARNLFFIARPRRFGKSLMLDTLQAIFEGKKELFEGLVISKTDYDWQTYPVIRLDFSGVDVSTVEKAEAEVDQIVLKAIEATGVECVPRYEDSLDLCYAIQQIHKLTGKKVVVLIDNFDAPVNDTYDDIAKAEAIQTYLACIYGALKANLADLHFALVTGETFPPWTAWNSRLNNIVDLTFDREVATLFGYTDEELDANFAEQMHAHAAVMGLPYDAYREQLRAWYGGYRFSNRCDSRVYNPAAIHRVLTEQRPVFTSTTTEEDHSPLVSNFAKRSPLAIEDLNGSLFRLHGYGTSFLEHISSQTIFYLTGYLTFDIVFEKGPYAKLKVPNNEIRSDIETFLKPLADSAMEPYKG